MERLLASCPTCKKGLIRLAKQNVIARDSVYRCDACREEFYGDAFDIIEKYCLANFGVVESTVLCPSCTVGSLRLARREGFLRGALYRCDNASCSAEVGGQELQTIKEKWIAYELARVADSRETSKQEWEERSKLKKKACARNS